jgi:TetR/AcrR family transcriptional repressor of bet genes
MNLTSIQDVRRHELLRAAFQIMKRDGLHQVTIDKIAREVGASRGIIHHYFKNKLELIELTLRAAHASRSVRVAEMLRHSQTPSERLWAVVSVNLDPAYLERGFCRLWISFSAEAWRNAQLSRLHRAVYKRERSNLLHALSAMAPRAQAMDVVFGITALIEGFRLRVALWSNEFEPALASAQVLSFLSCKLPNFDQAAATTTKNDDFE